MKTYRKVIYIHTYISLAWTQLPLWKLITKNSTDGEWPCIATVKEGKFHSSLCKFHNILTCLTTYIYYFFKTTVVSVVICWAILTKFLNKTNKYYYIITFLNCTKIMVKITFFPVIYLYKQLHKKDACSLRIKNPCYCSTG